MESTNFAEFYDEMSSIYDAERKVSYFESVLSGLSEHIEPPTRILEVGVGTGSYLLELAKQGNACSGLDYSKKMLSHAEVKFKEAGLDGHLAHADVQKEIPFEGEFNVILVVDVWEFVADGVACMENISKKLSENGTVILVTPNPFFMPLISFLELIGMKKLKPAFKFHQSSQRKIRSKIKDSGLKIVTWKYLFYGLAKLIVIKKG